MAQHGLPVQGSVLRTFSGSPSVHQGFRGRSSETPCSRSSPVTISRRLADPRGFPRIRGTESSHGKQPVQRLRSKNKRLKVRMDPIPEINLSGNGLGFETVQSVPFAGTHRTIREASDTLPIRGSPSSAEMGENLGHDVLDDPPNPRLSSSNASPSVCPEGAMAQQDVSFHERNVESTGERGNPLVASGGLIALRSRPNSSDTHSPP